MRSSLISLTALLSLGLATTALAGPGCSSGAVKTAKVLLEAKPDIVDTAVAAGSFQTLVAAVKAAGLVETLKGAGPFTVFAPTDEAFAALPEGALQALLADTDALRAVLTYHVLPGEFRAADLEDRRRAKTVQGERVRFAGEQGLTVDGASIVMADIVASNGVIHVIDAVILPPQHVGM